MLFDLLKDKLMFNFWRVFLLLFSFFEQCVMNQAAPDHKWISAPWRVPEGKTFIRLLQKQKKGNT